jgi:hypothetical protein
MPEVNWCPRVAACLAATFGELSVPAVGLVCERSKAQYLQNLASAVTDFWQFGHLGLTDAAHEGQKRASSSNAVEHLGQVSGIVNLQRVKQVL